MAGTEGTADSGRAFPVNVLSVRLCDLAVFLRVLEASCVFTVDIKEDRVNNDEVSLGMMAFCICSCFDAEGEGDLEVEIHDLRASLDKDRDIDLGLVSVLECRGCFVPRISNGSSLEGKITPEGICVMAASGSESDMRGPAAVISCSCS